MTDFNEHHYILKTIVLDNSLVELVIIDEVYFNRHGAYSLYSKHQNLVLGITWFEKICGMSYDDKIKKEYDKYAIKCTQCNQYEKARVKACKLNASIITKMDTVMEIKKQLDSEIT
jgi:hypothetical protein